MKRIVKMSVRIKGTDKIFAEGFAPGVIAEQELHFDEVPENNTFFLKYVLDKESEFLAEHVEVFSEYSDVSEKVSVD